MLIYLRIAKELQKIYYAHKKAPNRWGQNLFWKKFKVYSDIYGSPSVLS